MKLKANIYFNMELKDIKFADKAVVLKDKKIGKISKSYVKDGKLWVDILIDKNKVKQIQKMLGIE